MRVMQFADYGPPEVLQIAERPTPAPGPGEALIRVAAIGVNPADYKWRSGVIRHVMALSLPWVVGYDVAGEVAQVGAGVSALRPGDRVAVQLGPRMGAYAEAVVADAASCAKLPDALDFERAAAIPTPGLTGVQLIEEHVRPAPGETVLITGAVGAVGRFAVFAALAAKARVVAAVRASQIETALAIGAERAIALESPAPAELAVDHLADALGGPAVGPLCRLVRPGGRIISVVGPINGQDRATPAELVRVRSDGESLRALAEAVANGAVSIPIAGRLPLASAAEAHRRLEAGHVGGKLILSP
ncbi:MAG: NADP-dependent oxidoreductase [Caulobacteraceae bacterium]|nr:NADP-dependent oxidoreductase [Caulobacteraceae bacterium]